MAKIYEWMLVGVVLVLTGCGGGGGSGDKKTAYCPITSFTLEGTRLGDAQKGELLYSLPQGFESAADFRGEIQYRAEEGYELQIDGVPVHSGELFTFSGIQYGTLFRFDCVTEGKKSGALRLRFTNLPVIRLESNETIPDEPKVEGYFSLQSDQWHDYVDRQLMGIEMRGHTALRLPKKSYNVELRKDDECQSGKKLRLLGLRKDDDWIMDAAYRDTSFVRNLVSHDLFNAMRRYAHREGGEEKGQATIRGRLSEAYLNGDYRGIYIFQERVDRKLLDLKKIKVAKEGCRERWDEVNFDDPRNGSLLFKAVSTQADFSDKSNLHAGYVQKYPDAEKVPRWEVLDVLVDFVANSSDEVFIAEVADRFDLENLADYWILVMAARGTDNMRKNYYLARSGEGRFFLVPWDLDATWGIRWTGAKQEDPGDWFGAGRNRLFARLLAHPEIGFVTRVRQRWESLRQGELTVGALMDRFVRYKEEAERAGAAERTFSRWPGSGGEGSEDREELRDLSYLRNWIEGRMEYLDEEIAELPEAANLIPVADAGGWQVAEPGESVTLEGNTSYDPEGGSLRWRWRQREGEPVVLEHNQTASATFTAPEGPQRLVFELEVEDPEGNMARSRAVVWVKAEE